MFFFIRFTVAICCTFTLLVTTATSQPPYQSGFPYDPGGPTSEPALADLDGDGLPEVLMFTVGGLICLGHDGQVVPGWVFPQAPPEWGGFDTQKLVVGDITGDGEPEILTRAFTGQLYALDRLGQVLQGWPRPSPSGGGGGDLVLIDSNGDGVLELVSIDRESGEYLIHLFDGQGSILPGWPQTLASDGGPTTFLASVPAVADLDWDGKEELIVGTVSDDIFSRTFVFEEGGVVRDGWPAQVPSPLSYLSYKAVADLDGDGDQEIFGYGQSAMSAFNADGSHFWTGFVPPGTASRSIASADLDGDGQHEVISIGPSMLRVFSSDGVVLRDTFGDGLMAISGLCIADVDGDGDLEMAYEASTSVGGQVALNLVDHNLVPQPGFPMFFTGYVGGGSPDSNIFADFDGDGDLELAHSSGYEFHVFDLPAATLGEPRVVWQQRGNGARRSHWYFDDKRQFYRRGDATREGVVDVADAVSTLEQLFLGRAMPCEAALDANSDDAVDLSDVVFLLQHLFAGGAELAPPNANCVGFPAEFPVLSCEATRCP